MRVDPRLFACARRTVDVDGVQMAYVDEGSGPPVVMVHGNPTWGFAYRRLIDDLVDDHRVVVPDHVGMGRSARPTPDVYPYTLERRIADLGALLDRVVPTGIVDLVVHDWGGPIGLGWAVAHPERVGRVLAMNTVAFPLPVGERLPWVLQFARTPPGRALSRWTAAFNIGTALLGVRRRLPGPVVRGYLAPYLTPADREGVIRFVDDIPLDHTDAAWWPLARTAAGLDTLAGKEFVLCWGMRDPVFRPRLLDEWRRRLPGVRIVRLPRAGHLVMEDAPGQVGRIARELFAGAAPVPDGAVAARP